MVDAAASQPHIVVKAQGVDSPRPRRGRSLAVAVDATPMLGSRSGVGVMTSSLLDRLAANETIDLSGYVVSWRGRDRHRAVLPERCRPHWVPWPARVCHRLWRHVDRPRLASTFEVIHGTNYVVAPAAGAASLVTVHDLTAWRYPEMVDGHSAAYPVLVNRALQRGAHVHCVSQSVANEVVADIGVSPDRVHVIHNGVDPMPPGDPEEGRKRVGGPYVVVVGTIEPRKDHVGLVEAMARVWSHHDDLKLAVVGADGWGVEAYDEAVSRLNAGSGIVRLGYVSSEEKADLLAGAELLVFPSLYEGFGLPLLEAMQAGTPVVSTDVGAIPEVAGDAAILVPPRSPDDLADAILQLVDDTDKRERLRVLGRQRAARFSWDETATALADLYHHLAADRPSVTSAP